MNMPRVVPLGIMLIVIMAVMVTVHGESYAQDRSDPVIESLVGMDYLPEILEMRVQSPGPLDMLQMEFYSKYDPAHSGQELTDAEQRFFRTFLSDVDYPLSFQMTISNVLKYYREEGRIPGNGIDLLEFISGENTFNPEVSRLVALGPDREPAVYFKVFPTVFSMINPATGRYISSFQQEEWKPLGILISELDEIPEHYYVESADGEMVLPKGFTALRVCLYGETEDTIIYNHVVAEYVDSTSAMKSK